MVAAAAGSQTNTGFTWFLPAQTDKSGGISERPCHTLRARLTPELHLSVIARATASVPSQDVEKDLCLFLC